MVKFVYIPKNVCAEEMTFIIEGNNVLDATIKKGCPGGSQALCRAAATIKDIDAIVETFGPIACGSSATKTTSCAQQFALGLLIYKKIMLGAELTEEQKAQVVSFEKFDEVKKEEMLAGIEKKKIMSKNRNILKKFEN